MQVTITGTAAPSAKMWIGVELVENDGDIVATTAGTYQYSVDGGAFTAWSALTNNLCDADVVVNAAAASHTIIIRFKDTSIYANYGCTLIVVNPDPA